MLYLQARQIRSRMKATIPFMYVIMDRWICHSMLIIE
uniref:Uncharacterized protein n=1 Tax=Rhizophora mucronata TaxID=61149 RepID=A0A2P2NNK5_RHIMU